MRYVLTLEFGLAYDILIYGRYLPVAVDFVERFPLFWLASPAARARPAPVSRSP